MKKTILAQKIEAAGKVLAGHPVRINASADESSAEIMIYDVIGYDWWTGGGVTAKAIIASLNELRGADLLVRINSMGGDVVDGTAIYNAFKLHDGHVKMRIEGWACSMATVIACAGDEVEAFNNTMYMVHRSATCVCGNVKALRDTITLLEKIDGQMIATYQAKTGKTTEEITALVDGDVDGTWLTAKEAADLGFIDTVIADAGKATALLDKEGAKALGKDEGAQLLPTAMFPTDIPIAASVRQAVAKMLPPNIAATLGNNPAMGVVRMDGQFVAIGQDGVNATIEQTEDKQQDDSNGQGTTEDSNTGGDLGAGDNEGADGGGDQSGADTGADDGGADGSSEPETVPPKDKGAEGEQVDPVKAERARAAAITAACAAAGLPKMAQTFIDQGLTVEAASEQILAFKACSEGEVQTSHDAGLGEESKKIADGWVHAYARAQR